MADQGGVLRYLLYSRTRACGLSTPRHQAGRAVKGRLCDVPVVLGLSDGLFAVTDITSKSLRALMPGLLGTPYSMNQAGYDLTRLRLNGLIS
jgi:hypothetical protein